ncbi:MAG: glycosyltransferase family 4 protein [Anaerolineae bacterium]
MEIGKHSEPSRPVLLIDLAQRFGGAEVRVLDTARLLHGQYPYAVAVLAGSPLHQRLEAAGLASLPLPFSRSSPRIMPFLVDAIRRNGYQTVDAHNVQSQFWGHWAARWAGVPTQVSTVHSAYRLEHNGSLKGWLYEQVLRLNSWQGVHFIVVTEAIESYLRQAGIRPKQITLIHNSITLPADSLRRRDSSLLQALGWPEDAYIVIVVARLEPVKGHTYLIEAIKQVAGQRPRLRCLIVGEGRARAVLEAQIAGSNLQNWVHLAGFRDDVSALLQASDAFCLPSLSEGLPYALLEACAQRLPVLVTQVGGMAQILSHRRTGYLVPPADPAALTQGLEWLMNQPQAAAAMAQAAFEWLQQHFSPAEMLAKTLTVYHNDG